MSDRPSQIGERFLVVPPLLVRLTQSAGPLFRCALTALGEFRFHCSNYSVSSETCSSSYLSMSAPNTSISEASG